MNWLFFFKIKTAVNDIVCIDRPPLRKCARIRRLHCTLRWADNQAVFIQKYKNINGEGMPALVAVVLWPRLCGRKDSGSNYQDQVNLFQITDHYRKQLLLHPSYGSCH
jgi:hypothetical protein